jgi:WD repeat-containing protein 42A
VITCAADSEIRHIDITDPKKPMIHTFTEHQGMVKKMEIDPNSAHVFLSCSQDGTARFYDLRQKNNSSDSQIIADLRTGRSRLYHTNHTVDINSISLNMADSNYFAIGGGDSFLRLYDRPCWRNQVRRDTSLVSDLTNLELLSLLVTVTMIFIYFQSIP